MIFIESYTDILSTLCNTNKKFGLYLAFSPYGESPNEYRDDIFDEMCLAVPWIPKNYAVGLYSRGDVYVLFETEKDCREAFNNTVDGPTGYDGPARVFACICDDSGNILGENT
jgi:hypothetical protein